MRVYIIVITALLNPLFSKSQSAKTETFTLQKIIFHSSSSQGASPLIDLEIDSNKSFKLYRYFYLNKTDSLRSGNFKGLVTNKDYASIINLLRQCKIDSLTFSDILCCDAAEVTIIVYYNNKRKYFKSMFPPTAAKTLISFLFNLGISYELPINNEPHRIEE
jgi:hypothetical protein